MIGSKLARAFSTVGKKGPSQTANALIMTGIFTMAVVAGWKTSHDSSTGSIKLLSFLLLPPPNLCMRKRLNLALSKFKKLKADAPLSFEVITMPAELVGLCQLKRWHAALYICLPASGISMRCPARLLCARIR